MRGHSSRKVSLLLVGIFSLPVTVSAEDLGILVVTAGRTEQKIEEVPASISVIDSKELDTVKFVDSRLELLKRIPGYSMIRNLRIPMGSKNYTVNLIDGLATSSAFGSGTIGSLEDTNTFDIERVEVIRGPASALYGSNALGGVINVITRKPPLEPEYRIWGEGGMYQRGRGGVSAAGSVGAFGYFIDANKMEYSGWRDRSINNRKQVSAKAVVDIGDYSTLTVRSEYLDLYQENPGSLTQAQYHDDWQQAAVPDAYNDELAKSVSSKYELDLSDRSSIEISYGIRNTVSEGPPSYSATGGFGSSDVTNQNMVGIYKHDYDFYRSQLVAGIDLQNSDSNSITYEDRTADSDIAQEWDVLAEVASPFFQYEISPIDWMRLSVGARYDHIKYSAVGYKISHGHTTNYDEEITFSNLSPKAGVTFDLGNNNSLWFGYGQGFVVPSRTYLFVGGGYGADRFDANPSLQPETAENFEIGVRGHLFDSRLDYDITVYRTDIQDMLVGNSTLHIYENAGLVRVQGLESALGYSINDDWRFDITHTYADNKYIDFVSGSDDYSGNTLSASPKHHLDARLTWMPMHGLEAELEWNHISEYYTSNDNADPAGKAKRPDLFNLRVSYDIDNNWALWGHILNLTDRKYAERVSYSSSSGRSYAVGSPRTFYAGVTYEF